MGTFQVGECEVRGCSEKVFKHLPYCPIHCTPQNILQLTPNPVKVAQIVTEAKAEQKIRDAVREKKEYAAQQRKKAKLKKLGGSTKKSFGKSLRKLV